MTTSNFWNKTNTALSLIAIIVAIIIGWYFNRDKMTSLNIERVNATLLTQNLDINGLSVRYLYHDTIEVKNLWKTLFTIKNTGEQTLYGKGFSDMNVCNGVIPLKVSDCEKLLSIRITNNNNGTSLNQNQELVIGQWKPNEYTEIEVLSEGEGIPILEISAREIKDGILTYSQYTPTTKILLPKLIDRLPSAISNILKWVIVVIMGILVLAVVTQIPDQLKNKPISIKIPTIILWSIFIIILICPLLWMF